MHNNIMAVGSRDHPPMLATGRYPQWRSRFLRYIDIRPYGDALRKCILSCPYKPTNVLVQVVAATDDSPAIPEHTTVETPMNMSPENKTHFQAEKEAINLILTGIGDEIYSTVDACQTAQEMWEAIERLQQAIKRLQQGESLNIQDVKTNLFWEFASARMVKVQNDAGYNVFVNDLQHSEQSESVSNIRLVETNDSNVIPDSPDMCEDDIQNEQNEVKNDDERVALANLIANLKLDVDGKKDSKAIKESKHNTCSRTERTKQAKFEKYKAFNDRTIDYDKLEQIVDNAWIKHSKDQFRAPTTQDMKILIQTCLMPLVIKTQDDSFLFVHELKQEMHADLKYVESLKKEIDELESDKAEFSNMYDMILQEYMSNDVKCSYLQSLSDLDALTELQCLYLHKVKECDCLAQKLSKQTESVSKEVHNELLQRFDKVEKHSISLEISLQKRKEQKLIEKGKGKSVDTKFDKPSVVRQPNAQRIPKPSILGVNHKPNVSRPHHKSNQLKDKVLPNNSQVKLKKTQVEVHHRISSVSNRMKSVTACKDSLNSRTLNANAVCATCNKCSVDSNHFACVTKMLNDFAPIIGYGDLVHGNVTINRVYYVKGLNHNLLSVGQFCDADLEVAFRKSTCFIRDLQGNDLLTDDYSRYTWTLLLCSKDETPEVLKEFLTMIQRNLQAPVITVRTDRGTKFLNKTLNAFFKEEGIEHQTSTARTPKQNGASDYDNSDPVPQRKDVSSSVDAHVPSQQELDLLFGPLYDEFFNAGSNPQNKQPTTNIQTTSAPSTPTYVHAEENNDDQAKEDHLLDDEFTNPSCAPTQEVAESSSHKIGNSNVPTFNQPQASKYRWTKDHPLEQVRGNPSRPVQTRRQLATDPEMCMFMLTVSTAKPKNIKKAMADSAWIEAMQEELHQKGLPTQKSSLWIEASSKGVVRRTLEILDIKRYDGDECDIGRMQTKIELALKQSQQGVSNDVLLSIEGVEELERNVWIKGEKKEALPTLKAETESIHMLSVFTKVNSGIEDKTSWTQ
nr:integrase, catalytic region, zinc finger, CCHC-type, peptidase aspartic, catalytic [Tanacetum cinerariifolium]